jgi:hypothetical protein
MEGYQEIDRGESKGLLFLLAIRPLGQEEERVLMAFYP